jgi:hypothetical protein
MPSVIVLVVFLLATARVVRFVTTDRLFRWPREAVRRWSYMRVYRKLGPEPTQAQLDKVDEPLPAYMIGCPWCMSIYLGAGAAPLAYLWGARPWLFVPALALAISYTVGFLAQIRE